MQSTRLIDAFVTADVAAFAQDAKPVRSARSSPCSEFSMPAPALSGPQYLREGLKLVLSPSLRLFVLLPLAINLVLFVGFLPFAGISGWLVSRFTEAEWVVFIPASGWDGSICYQ
mgnify:CR=1 FL=1